MVFGLQFVLNTILTWLTTMLVTSTNSPKVASPRNGSTSGEGVQEAADASALLIADATTTANQRRQVRVKNGRTPDNEAQSITSQLSNDNQQRAGATNQDRSLGAKRAARCYYIDELGFYRHLDPDHQVYVCSNVSAMQVPDEQQESALASHSAAHPNREEQPKRRKQQLLSSNRQHLEEARISAGDGGYELCFKALRKDLGISHFDRLDDYQEWKCGWDEFMRSKLTSSQPVMLNRELKSRVRSGIPHDYRCKVWSALIRMRTRAIRAQVGEDIYESIVHEFVSKVRVPNYTNQKLPADSAPSRLAKSEPKSINSNNKHNQPQGRPSGTSYLDESTAIDYGLQQQQVGAQIYKCYKQIELDLLRTLPNNRHFEEPNSRGIQRVRRVLRAYACFNQTVGYCQGMNRLAAMALLVLPEEEAFWCLVAIIQCIMPKDYYLRPWLAQVDCCVLGDFLEKKMPKLHKHLQQNDIQLTLFTWFFTIFVDGFRPELMLRIWDCFLLEGDKVLFRFALSILWATQADLLEMHDLSTMSAHLSRLVSTRQLDVERLFESK